MDFSLITRLAEYALSRQIKWGYTVFSLTLWPDGCLALFTDCQRGPVVGSFSF